MSSSSTAVAEDATPIEKEAPVEWTPDQEVEREKAREAARDQMIAAIRAYASQVTIDKKYFPVVPPDTLTATDAMIVATALLKAVNVQVFELGLWQAWGQ